jgi:hypothetical protein
LAITPGDHLGALAQWNGSDTLNALAGRTVALRFVLDDATIYSFHFSGGAGKLVGPKFLDDGFEDDTVGANPNAPTFGSWVKASQTTTGATIVNSMTPGPFAGTNYLKLQRTTGAETTARIEASFETIPIGDTIRATFAYRYESTGSSSTAIRLMSGTAQRTVIIGEPDYSVPNFYTLNGTNSGQVNSSLAVTPGAWQTIGIQYTSGSSDLNLTVNGVSETLVGAVTGGTIDRIRFSTASTATTYYIDGVDSLTVSPETLPSLPGDNQFTGVARTTDGNIKLTYQSVSGASGDCYTLWASTNINLRPIQTTWTPLTNGTLVTPTEFTDTEAAIYPCRYYVISSP